MAYRITSSTQYVISANTWCRIYSGSYTDDTENTVVREININENSTPEEYAEAVAYINRDEVGGFDLSKETYTPITLRCKSNDGNFNYLKKLKVDESMFTEIKKYRSEKQNEPGSV